MPPIAILPAARPDPFAYQNTQAFRKIFQTLGQFETLRRQKMLNTDILRILQGGGDPQTIMQGIAGAVQQHQQPTYSPEFLPGLFQRIAAPFAQAPGAGMTEALTAQAFTPEKPLTMSDIRMQEYMKAVAAGDEERADKLLMSSLVTIQTGERLLTPEQRQALADKGFAEEMGMAEAQRNTARKSVKTIVSEMEHGTWAGDMKFFKNFKRSNLIQGYKQYRTENDYASKSAENRKWLDKNWDDQMTTYNKAGYKEHGKDEFDWDPKDPKVVELRKDTVVGESDKEKAAYRMIYDAWDQFSKELQNAIRLKEQKGEKYTDILQYDEVQELLKKIVK